MVVRMEPPSLLEVGNGLLDVDLDLRLGGVTDVDALDSIALTTRG
jgi:hypothetical protein